MHRDASHTLTANAPALANTLRCCCKGEMNMKLKVKLTNSWVRNAGETVLIDEIIDTNDGENELIYGSLILTIKKEK
jgi:hypothetical protein